MCLQPIKHKHFIPKRSKTHVFLSNFSFMWHFLPGSMTGFHRRRVTEMVPNFPRFSRSSFDTGLRLVTEHWINLAIPWEEMVCLVKLWFVFLEFIKKVLVIHSDLFSKQRKTKEISMQKPQKYESKRSLPTWKWSCQTDLVLPKDNKRPKFLLTSAAAQIYLELALSSMRVVIVDKNSPMNIDL